jgi:NAD(P)-dependent dehydrogenase (short-subunit alcohol dehydrogenase family)
MDVRGTVTLITGAKRIGAVVAEAIAARGGSVALSYARSEDEARAAAAKVEALGGRSLVVQADLTEPEACARLVDETVGSLGRLDVLINMASVYANTPLGELALDEWEAVVNVDLRAAYLCALAAIPHMKRAGGGRIVNFSDWVAASSRPRYHGFVPYYVAKAGVKALSEALALEVAADNILVNTIAPGPIVAPPAISPEEYAAVEQATPLGRWGGEPEIAKAVLSFIESDFITGETIRVDGGRHLK